MPLRVLELDPLHLINPGAHLKLSVVSAADVRFPSSIPTLEDHALLKALISGKMWVSRGIACHLDIQILFNGKPLDRSGRVNVLESLGYRIRDAQLWSQLSLSASLDVWQDDRPADPVPNLSINISDGLETPIPQTRYRAWALESFDIKPPDTVICAEFERIQIQFNFLVIQEKSKGSKRVKSDAVQFDDGQEVTLLDFTPEFDAHSSINELAHAVEGMQDLSALIGQCFASRLDHKDKSAPLPQPSASTSDENRGFHGPSLVPNAVEHGTRTEKKGSKLPHEGTEVLKGWLQAHTDNPYPSNAEKLELMGKTGLKRSQISAWFYRQRCTLRKVPSLTDPEILLEQTNERVTPLAQIGDQEDDDMLLTQTTEHTPSLTSQESFVSAGSISHSDSSLKRQYPGDEVHSLDKSLACELVEAAIHILISGYIDRGLRGLGGVQVENPPPSLSMASIAPAVFCPGFKESMAHNAHFLPSISNAVALSWPRNTQSPTLRRKLMELANSPPSSLTDETQQADGEAGRTTRLAAVVQSRLWGMMQRTLYDPTDAAKVWRKSTSQGKLAEEDQCPDLLATLGRDEAEGQAISELAEFMDDELDEFEDLLSGDDDGLLGYLEERERLSVERETEEMLFGSGWDGDQEDEDDVCLLESESRSDIMLL